MGRLVCSVLTLEDVMSREVHNRMFVELDYKQGSS